MSKLHPYVSIFERNRTLEVSGIPLRESTVNVTKLSKVINSSLEGLKEAKKKSKKSEFEGDPVDLAINSINDIITGIITALGVNHPIIDVLLDASRKIDKIKSGSSNGSNSENEEDQADTEEDDEFMEEEEDGSDIEDVEILMDDSDEDTEEESSDSSESALPDPGEI